MAIHAYRRQAAAEADRVAAQARHFAGRAGLIPRGETVHPQPEDAYRPPAYLDRTAPPELVTELKDLLHELWAENREFVGEKVLEVQAYYTATGRHLDLEERLRSWCDRYFTLRADPRFLTPQVRNNPFLLACRVQGEAEDLLLPLHDRKHSVNTMFLRLPLQYTAWRLYDLLGKDLVGFDADGAVAVNYLPASPDLPKVMAEVAIASRWVGNFLPPFLDRVAAGVDPSHAAALTDDELRSRVAALAEDVRQMRPFLVRNFKPRKTALDLGPGVAAAWSWRVGCGIANLVVGESLADVARLAAVGSTGVPVLVGHDGLLSDVRTPWLTTGGLGDPGLRPLSVNLWVLERFHERLFSFYDRIDLDRVARGPRPRTAEGGPDELAVAAGCRVLAESGAGSPAPAGAGGSVWRLPGLRMEPLLRTLARLGCEVRQGKGSEVTVYQTGGRLFTLGRHARNREVHSVEVRRLLARLGVTPAEWLTAVGR